MSELLGLVDQFKAAERAIYDYFRIPRALPDTNFVGISGHYWCVDEYKILHQAKTLDDFAERNYYSSEDSCDGRVAKMYSRGDFVILQIGVGEHFDARLEIFRKDRQVAEEDLIR